MIIAPIIGILLVLTAPAPAFAHSFGQLYTLPIPFWMYLYGAAAALLLSFFVITYLASAKVHKSEYPLVKLPLGISRFFKSHLFINLAKAVSVFLLFLTIATGLFGQDSAAANFNMTFFWIIFVLGLFYLTAIFGDVYNTINPWKTIITALENIFKEKSEGILNYPKWLKYYPALILYFLFIWEELFGQTGPAKLSVLLLNYTTLTFVGTYAFGKEMWFKYCEFFSVLFRLVGKIAPVESTKEGLVIRPPFVGLIKSPAEHFSLLLFILFILSSTAFDGFHSTTPYLFFYWQYVNEILRPLFGQNSFGVFQTFSLLLSPCLFLGVYLVLVFIMKIIAKSRDSVGTLSLLFAMSLVPIAFVYNIAHYYTLVFTEGPNIIRLISDPFGVGWNIFKTADFQNTILIGASFIWHSQVGVILAGHIAGVYLAHLTAIKIFKSPNLAAASQFPMLILMVIYTIIGLWILSQPITSG